MAQFVCDNIYILILLPLWIFLMIMCGRFFSVYVNKFITYILTMFSSLLGLVFSCVLFFTSNVCDTFENYLPFIQINDFAINAGIYADKLSLIFAFVMFSVSFAVQIFSIFYMKNENKQYRFFALLNLFNFSTAGLFFSPNLFQFYVFWELTGIASYLLIGFDYAVKQKSKAAKKVFLINRIGDTALIGGIILCSYLIYEYAPSKMLATLPFFDINKLSMLIGGYTSDTLMLLIGLLFVFAALVKSAQAPFYNWLQDAMEAKLPVSALLHSSTLVAAGLYLVLRIMPILSINERLPEIIAVAGLVTSLVCSLCACAQTHPKKTLAYSTSAQFGLMFFAAGIMNFKAAAALFCAHAFIKPILFMTLPEENHSWNKFDAASFVIAGLSLSGIILSGLASKEMVIYSAGNYTPAAISILSFLTAFYISRIAFLIYKMHGFENGKTSILKIIPIMFLFGLNTGLYLYLRENAEYKLSLPFFTAILAIVLCAVLFYKNYFKKVPVLYNLCLNGFYLDKFYNKVLCTSYNKASEICKLIDESILANYNPCKKFAVFSVKSVHFIEKNIVNEFVKLITDSLRKISYADSKSQNGNIQRYNFYALIIITIITALIVLAYGALISSFSGG